MKYVFRMHRGTYEDAKKTEKKFNNISDIIKHVQNIEDPFIDYQNANITIVKYNDFEKVVLCDGKPIGFIRIKNGANKWTTWREEYKESKIDMES